jgi:hypothetical protein
LQGVLRALVPETHHISLFKPNDFDRGHSEWSQKCASNAHRIVKSQAQL